jgi:hypothetical protein
MKAIPHPFHFVNSQLGRLARMTRGRLGHCRFAQHSHLTEILRGPCVQGSRSPGVRCRLPVPFNFVKTSQGRMIAGLFDRTTCSSKSLV